VSDAICPFCGGDLLESTLLDDEMEGWECEDCDAATLGSWDDGPPPKHTWDWPPEGTT
jgi:hypothetical protein